MNKYYDRPGQTQYGQRHENDFAANVMSGITDNTERSYCNPLQSRIFTLIELLVVMAIISILAAIMLPALGKAQNQARAIQCVGNLKQVGIMISGYAGDFEDRFASSDTGGGVSATWSEFLISYNNIGDSSRAIFLCPSSSQKVWHTWYTYAALYRSGLSQYTPFIRLNKIRQTSRAMLVGDGWDALNSRPNFRMYRQKLDNYGNPHLLHNSKANFLFADMHVSAKSFGDIMQGEVLYKDTYEEQFGLNVKFENVFSVTGGAIGM